MICYYFNWANNKKVSVRDSSSAPWMDSNNTLTMCPVLQLRYLIRLHPESGQEFYKVVTTRIWSLCERFFGLPNQ